MTRPSTDAGRPARPVRAAAGALLVLALAACAPDADPEPAPTSEAPPEPTVEPVTDPGPQPRLPFDCEGLLPTVTLQEFMGARGAPLALVDPAERLAPDDAASVQLGALDCVWSNGVEASTWTGPGPDRQYVSLRVLPEAVDGATAYVDMYGADPSETGDYVQGPRCFAELGPDGGFCELHGLVGTSWVALVAGGRVVDGASDVAVLDAFRAMTEPLTGLVRSAPVGPAWQPAQTLPMTGCDALAASDQIAEVTGLSEIGFGLMWDGPRIGQYSWASTKTGAARCSIFFTDRDGGFGAVHVLPGGAWGFERFSSTWTEQGAEPVEIVGVAAGDALLRCAGEGSPCRLDVRIGGAWLRVEFPELPGAEVDYLPENDYAAARSSVVEVGRLIAANLVASGAVTS